MKRVDSLQGFIVHKDVQDPLETETGPLERVASLPVNLTSHCSFSVQLH